MISSFQLKGTHWPLSPLAMSINSEHWLFYISSKFRLYNVIFFFETFKFTNQVSKYVAFQIDPSQNLKIRVFFKYRPSILISYFFYLLYLFPFSLYRSCCYLLPIVWLSHLSFSFSQNFNPEIQKFSLFSKF